MASVERTFSNQQLFYENPIRLEREGETLHDGYPQYEVKLRTNNEVIGVACMNFRADGWKEIVWPTLCAPYRDRGYGTALYVAAAGLTSEDGRNPILYSANRRTLSEGARHVWESLARRGLAEAPGWDNGRYHYLGQHAMSA